MNTVQTFYPPQLQSYEQRKATYDKMYDKYGNPTLFQSIHAELNNGPMVLDARKAAVSNCFNAYAVEKVGDDYIVFNMNPIIHFGGEKNLTKEQLAYLQDKYDMNNLSKEDRIKLLAELSCIGVISGQQAWEESFPEKCHWLRDQKDKFGINCTEMDLEAWIQYFAKRSLQAKNDMNNIIASAGNSIPYYEAERRAHSFYSTLTKVIKQIAQVQ